MPRTNIPYQDANAVTFPWTVAGLTLTATAADVANKNETPACGQLLLIAHNSGASTRNITITSSPDSRFGRSGDATVVLLAGKIWCHVIVRQGWEQTGALFYFEADHADVEFSLVRMTT